MGKDSAVSDPLDYRTVLLIAIVTITVTFGLSRAAVFCAIGNRGRRHRVRRGRLIRGDSLGPKDPSGVSRSRVMVQGASSGTAAAGRIPREGSGGQCSASG
jgi:hypothetical protein